MGVKVHIKEVEYKDGCIVRNKTFGWYGILYITSMVDNTCSVLKFDEEGEGSAYLSFTYQDSTLSEIKSHFEVIAEPKDYDLTLTLKGDN